MRLLLLFYCVPMLTPGINSFSSWVKMCTDVLDLLKTVALLKPGSSLPQLTEREVVLSLCGLLSVVSRHEQDKTNITLGK